MSKKIVVSLIILSVSLLLFGCFWIVFKDKYLSKDEIYDVVNKKFDTIMSDIHNDNFFQTEFISGIERVETHDGVIEFACGGHGNVAYGIYYGFYYIEDNMLKVSFLRPAVLHREDDLVQMNNGYGIYTYDYYYT